MWSAFLAIVFVCFTIMVIVKVLFIFCCSKAVQVDGATFLLGIGFWGTLLANGSALE